MPARVLVHLDYNRRLDMKRRGFERWEPTLGHLEGDYRRHFLPSDIAQARVAGWLGVAAILLFLLPDYFFFGWSAMFGVLLALRLAHVALAAALIWRLRRVQRPEALDRLVIINELNIILVSVLVYALRPPEVWLGHVFGALMILAFYALVPQPLGYRVWAGVLFALAMCGVAWLTRSGLTQVERVGTLVGLAGANLLGFLASVRLNNYRRQQYQALLEEQQSRRALELLATTDSLTGVLNRRSFMEAAEQEVRRFQRYGRPFTVVVIDLDHFKRVNDTHGHHAGDEALRVFARLARRVQRGTDLVGRMGGEEFGLLLPETSLVEGLAVAERLRAELAEQVVRAPDARFGLTLSAGAAEASRTDAGLDDLMRRADRALYRAKGAGRDRVEAAGVAA
jgi:diguanylate cyclase (GGDEF)-like protein